MASLLQRLFGRLATERPVDQNGTEPGARLRTYLARRGHQYRVWVGVPVEAPLRWIRLTGWEPDLVRTEDGETLHVADVRSFIVAYPNGQYLESANTFYPWPEGVRFTTPSQVEGPRRIRLNDLRADGGVTVTHTEFRTRERRLYHATTLTNHLAEPVRVLSFAAYHRRSGSYEISTITGALFSAEEFQQWYGVPTGWIDPGASAMDPDNYGRKGALWVYFCETAGGEHFAVGARVP